jgi:hypothetical protein
MAEGAVAVGGGGWAGVEISATGSGGGMATGRRGIGRRIRTGFGREASEEGMVWRKRDPVWPEWNGC